MNAIQLQVKNFIMHFQKDEEEDEDDENFDYAAMPYYVDKIKSLK